MQPPPLDPDVDDTAPTDPKLTVYDEQHLVTYLRLLDADAEGADWRDVARIVLHVDPARDWDRAHRSFRSHLARAKWITKQGYKHLLKGGASACSGAFPSAATVTCAVSGGRLYDPAPNCGEGFAFALYLPRNDDEVQRIR